MSPAPRITDLWRLGPAEVVCAVGAGGKTSLLERIARDYETEGARALLTTTTRVRPPGPGGRPLILADSLQELVARVEGWLGSGAGRSPFVGRAIDPAGKLDGVPSEWVPELRDLAGVAAVLVEADGSKGLPLKAPAAWEPVIPECASLVVALAGLDAQGVPLDERHVHRPELLADLLGLRVGERASPASLLAALVRGYAPATPRRARLVVAFNKADLVPPAAELLEACESSPFEAWAGSLAGGAQAGDAAPEAWRRLDVGGGSGEGPDVVVLAAGLARRMGVDKLLAPLGAGSVLGRVVGAVAGWARVGRVVVVTGPDSGVIARALRAECPGGGYSLAANPDPSRGMGSSLSLGVAALYPDTVVARSGCRDLLVLLGDQPFVTRATLGRILRAAEAHPRAAATGLARSGGVGPPVLLHRSLLPLMAELPGDQGARGLLARFASSVVGVTVVDGEDLDVDTPADLERARLRVGSEDRL